MNLDKLRLDYLQQLLDRKKYTGRVILRDSTTGRGFRLHETSRPEGFTSVRDAIDAVIRWEKVEGNDDLLFATRSTRRDSD